MRNIYLRWRRKSYDGENRSENPKITVIGIKNALKTSIIGIFTIIAATPVMGSKANFGTLRLTPGFDPSKTIVSGYTGGSYSLSTISNRDRDRNICVGYADPKPDHIVILEKDFGKLRFLVNSEGADTTILIQGPDDKTIRCGDDTGRKKDASYEGSDFKAGTYRVWVGIFNPGTRVNYTLSAQQP